MTDNVSDEEIEAILAASDAAAPLPGKGTTVGRPAPDFKLFDQSGGSVRLADCYRQGPVLLAFYPTDFSLVCTRQLCNYRDSIAAFNQYHLQVLGISGNSVERHAKFVQAYSFPFRLLCDDGLKVAKAYGCASVWMLSRISRAVFIINRAGIILYRYVEPTVLTRRSAKELTTVLAELHRLKLI